ncbi:MAG: sensor histidine kinase [Planctomycetota bacterium]
MRTKILLSICVVNVVVLLLLTVNLGVDAVARARKEMHRNAELLGRLVSDWIEKERGLDGELDAGAWGDLERRFHGSTLVSGFVIASGEGDGMRIYVSSDPDRAAVLREEGENLSEVFSDKWTVVHGNRVYTRLETPSRRVYAARFDLNPAAVSASWTDLGESIPGLLSIMGLGTVLLMIVTYILLNRFVLRPLDSLADASGRVARGDFDVPIPHAAGYDEMGRMVGAFNLMMHEIAQSQRAMEGEIREGKVRISETEKRLFAAQRLSTMGTLAAGIAHEINNPIGGMMNAVQALRHGGVDDRKRAEYVDLVGDGLDRIREIVAKVLKFTPKSLEATPVHLRDVVEQAVAFLEHRFRERNVACVNRVHPDAPRIRGDALELQQVFLNLLLNALDAAEPGAGEVLVTSSQEGDETVRISVADDGRGMAEEEMRRCFDPFFTTKQVGEGSGLGLSVANTIVANHGGGMDVASEKGKGTTVTMIFPALRESRMQ